MILQILITVLWVGYGLLSNYQLENKNSSNYYFILTLHIALAPIVFLCRALYGAFILNRKQI